MLGSCKIPVHSTIHKRRENSKNIEWKDKGDYPWNPPVHLKGKKKKIILAYLCVQIQRFGLIRPCNDRAAFYT